MNDPVTILDRLPRPNDDAPSIGSHIKSVLLSEVRPEPLQPIWPDVLYRGKVTLISGNPGDGKTLIACDIATRISKGMEWPCAGGSAPSGHILYLSVEDDPADTLRPRIEVAGGNLEKIELLQGVWKVDSKSGQRTLDPLRLSEDLDQLERKINETGAILLIIDPLTSFADRDTNKTSDARHLIDRLTEIARRTGTAILVINHFNKRSDARNALQQVAGNHALVAGVRFSYVTAIDPKDRSRRLLLPHKVNLAKGDQGYSFRISGRQHSTCGETPTVDWEQERYQGIADDVVGERGHSASNKLAEDDVAWLKGQLADGPRRHADIETEAKREGINPKRLREASRRLGVINKPIAFGGVRILALPVGVCREEPLCETSGRSS